MGPQPVFWFCCLRVVVHWHLGCIGGIVFAPYRRTGHAAPALHGLTGGHVHEWVLMSTDKPMGVMIGEMFHWRVKRVVEVVLIPTFAACRKLAMRLFLWWEKRGRP